MIQAFFILFVAWEVVSKSALATREALHPVCESSLKKASLEPVDLLLERFSQNKRPPFDLKTVHIEYAKDGSGAVFSVMKVNEKVIGYSRLWKRQDGNYSHQFVTLASKEYQGFGIGQLFYTGLGFVVTQNMRKNLLPDSTNRSSLRVWRSLDEKGFAKNGQISKSQYIGGGVPNALHEFWSKRVQEVPFQSLAKEYTEYDLKLEFFSDL